MVTNSMHNPLIINNTSDLGYHNNKVTITGICYERGEAVRKFKRYWVTSATTAVA